MNCYIIEENDICFRNRKTKNTKSKKTFDLYGKYTQKYIRYKMKEKEIQKEKLNKKIKY